MLKTVLLLQHFNSSGCYSYIDLNTLKKILFPLLSLFLVYRSIDLLGMLLSANASEYTLFEHFLLAFLLSAFITGVFAVAGFAYPSNRLLPPAYYNINNPERLKTYYKLFGINYFRKTLLIFFWGHKKNRKKYFDGTRNGLQNFIYQSKQSEFGHLLSFLFIVSASIILLFYNYPVLVAFLTLINFIGNLFPVILQRYHRMRIAQLESRL